MKPEVQPQSSQMKPPDVFQYIQTLHGKERAMLLFVMVKIAGVVALLSVIVGSMLALILQNDDILLQLWAVVYLLCTAGLFWDYRRKQTVQTAGAVLGPIALAVLLLFGWLWLYLV